MVRRSFRIGLRVGLLLGLVFAVVKTLQSKRAHDEPAAPRWTPVPPEPDAPGRPARPRVADAPAPPVGPDVTPEAASPPTGGARPRDEVGEPIEEPSPEPAPATARPATTAPAVKATAKKATGSRAAGKKAGRGASVSEPTAKKATAKRATVGSRAWVEPSDDACPPSHPLKAKLSSKIFHRPGGLSYDRTTPDRCYADEAAAEADGLRAAKR